MLRTRARRFRADTESMTRVKLIPRAPPCRDVQNVAVFRADFVADLRVVDRLGDAAEQDHQRQHDCAEGARVRPVLA